jgi:putative flippase GtrA
MPSFLDPTILAGFVALFVAIGGAFLAVNLLGFACNYGTYALLVAGMPFVAANPVLGVAAGSLAGMVGNFVLSRRYVFRNA